MSPVLPAMTPRLLGKMGVDCRLIEVELAVRWARGTLGFVEGLLGTARAGDAGQVFWH
ncbi:MULTISPECIES: hypothetical protein [unclassified Sphingomonas]|uniref:hypothetical protein n=1 Tax=unclassified Sphingomonas TaxID=196159 RepID=UPI0012E3E3C2|nr:MULTISPECIES: hypothetical protein [unclassified Sphingomonas]